MKRVALLIETTRSYTRDMLSGIRSYLESHGPWSTFIELRAFESSLPPWLGNWDGNGIITRTHSQKMADAIALSGVPAIEVRSTNYGKEFPFVGMDNALIGQSVAEHFLNRGYRHFAAYTLDSESFFQERVQNFVSRIHKNERGCEELPATGDRTIEDWEAHQADLMAWLSRLEKPVGIFAANDQLAARLLDACQRANLAVPEEVAVVGCENEETLCEFSNPPLTSVRFDGETVGFEAARLLDEMMREGNTGAREVLIPPKGIVVRGSSDEFVLEDPVVLRAIRLIRAHAFEGVSVAEICEALGVSRSTLERRMKKCLRRGAKEEILRLRFREVNRLLLQTNLTVETIAAQTGFSHPHYLQTAFRERFGLTPGQYRTRKQGE
ncbi:MAG: substrate-binding domain-containing protein [Verrucomicrobiota bacterium]